MEAFGKVNATRVSVGIGCVAAAAVCAPTAAAAPSEPSATETISQLESEGYRVILSKVGSGSIDDCSVSAVRQGRSVTGPQPPVNGNFTLMGPGQVLQYTTVYVDLDCKR
ncbi:hypothetical protein ACWDTP_08675 [Mycobacterium sp. NPDC003449]